METLIDSLDLAEQKKIDPQLFTCCPACNHQFKIVDPTQLTMGKWGLWKDVTFYDENRLPITRQQSHLLYEIAKSNIPMKAEKLGYRISGRNALEHTNLVGVQICRLKKKLLELKIPYPLHSAKGIGYSWNPNS